MIRPIIRPATAADIPAITTIYADAVTYGTATFEIEPPSEREMANRFRALADGGFPYFVAARYDEVLGYAYAGPHRTRIAYLNTPLSEIHSKSHQSPCIAPLASTSSGRSAGSASNLAGGSIPCSCSARWVRKPRHCHKLGAFFSSHARPDLSCEPSAGRKPSHNSGVANRVAKAVP
jgi:hypothetical protein